MKRIVIFLSLFFLGLISLKAQPVNVTNNTCTSIYIRYGADCNPVCTGVVCVPPGGITVVNPPAGCTTFHTFAIHLRCPVPCGTGIVIGPAITPCNNNPNNAPPIATGCSCGTISATWVPYSNLVVN